MKKLLSLLSALVLIIGCLILVACDDDDHTHSYGEWSVTKAADCTNEGERERSCECGEKENETVEARGHNYVEGICTDCGEEE